MKVIKKKIQETTQIECAWCESILEYVNEDIQLDNENQKYIICPECDHLTYLIDMDKDPEEKILTINNIQFPEDFYQFGTSDHAVKIDDEEINERIQKCLEALEENKKDYGVFHYIGSGDSVVIVVKHEDEYVVFICKDYYEAAIER